MSYVVRELSFRFGDRVYGSSGSLKMIVISR